MIRTKIKFVIDGRQLPSSANLDTNTSAILRQHQLIGSETKAVAFSGLIQSETEQLISLPKTFVLRSHRENLMFARMVIRAIRKYERGLSKEERSESTLIGRGLAISTALALLDDWMRHGEYRTDERLFRRDSRGRINWKRTISQLGPLYLENTPFYSEHIVQKRVPDTENFVRRIHHWAVHKSDRFFGWLVSEHGTVAPELIGLGDKGPGTKKECLRALTSALQKTFSDRKISLLKYLIEFVRESPEDDGKGGVVYGTRNFHHLWEEVCRSVLKSDSEDVKGILPQPRYVGLRGSNPSQRPDIVLVSPQHLVVLDAKYYDTTISLPGWSDLIKQFLYANTLEEVAAGKAVTNFLVFPSAQKVELLFSHLPYVVIQSAGAEVEKLGTIYCLHVSLEDLVRSYCLGRTDTDVRAKIFQLSDEIILKQATKRKFGG